MVSQKFRGRISESGVGAAVDVLEPLKLDELALRWLSLRCFCFKLFVGVNKFLSPVGRSDVSSSSFLEVLRGRGCLLLCLGTRGGRPPEEFC